MAAGAAALLWARRAPALTEKDAILLADIVNTTGDPVFDGTLKQALAVQLEQSPYLNIVPEDRVRRVLGLMGRARDERLTGQLARDLCEREGIKALLTGTISSVGAQYVVDLNAVNCRSGESLAREQAQAGGKEQVLPAVGKAASDLRRKLGESLTTIQKLDAPIEEATTSSLEAFKLFTLGEATRAHATETEAVPFYERALEIDPNFALAYARIGVIASNAVQPQRAAEFLTKAYERRDRVSERERLYLTAHYYTVVTGELEKQIDALKLFKQTYPHDFTPPNNLAVGYLSIGQGDTALREAQEAARLNPDHALPCINTAAAFLSLHRLDEARAVLQQGFAKGFDAGALHTLAYRVAFLQNDAPEMHRQAEWFRGKPSEFLGRQQEAYAAAAVGTLRDARELFRQAIDLAQRRQASENAAAMHAGLAVIEAQFGNAGDARAHASAALGISRGPTAMALAANALARAGAIKEAEATLDELRARRPLDTLVTLQIAMTRGLIEIGRGNGEAALERLRPVAPYPGLAPFGAQPSYVRAETYRLMGRATEAVAQYRDVIDHRGRSRLLDWGPMALVGLARAQAAAGDVPAARKAYQDFFALWKNADADIPLLRDARAEYARLGAPLAAGSRH